MFDFSVTKESLSFEYPFFSLFLYIIIYLRFHKDNNWADPNKIRMLWLLIFVFSIAAYYDGDFYHYMDIVHNFSVFNYTHLEKIYMPIILFVERNYLLFRIVVWGGALLITTNIFNRLKFENLFIYIFVFFVLYIIRFAYVRAALAYAFYYWGFSFLIKQYNHKYLSYLYAFILIYISTLFHNSVILLVAMTFLLLVPLNRKMLVAIVLLLPAIYVLFGDLFYYLLMQDDLGADGVVSSKMKHYTEGNMSKMGFSGMLILLGEIITFYGFYIYILIKSYKNYCSDSILLGCYKIILGILFVAFFLFMLGTGSSYLFPRIMEMAYIPMVVIICRFYELGYLERRTLKKIINVGMIVSVIRLTYSVYIIVQ